MSSGSGPAAEPGPPPLPPSDLTVRRLPIEEWTAALCRIHPVGKGALFFGPAAGTRPRGRWDAPARRFGVCYLAEDGHTAFAETFLRTPGITFVAEREPALRSLALVEPVRPLRLAAMHGRGLARVGATAAVCSGPYAVSRAWSLALHGHPETPDGVLYRARHDDDGLAVALFDRAADAVREVRTRALVLPDAAEMIAGWLDRYGLGLL